MAWEEGTKDAQQDSQLWPRKCTGWRGRRDDGATAPEDTPWGARGVERLPADAPPLMRPWPGALRPVCGLGASWKQVPSRPALAGPVLTLTFPLGFPHRD